MSLPFLFLLVLFSCVQSVRAVLEPTADISACDRKCGDITVPYPFGLGNSSECFKDSSFQLVCNQSTLLLGNMQLVNISLEEGTASIYLYIAIGCRGMTAYETIVTLSPPFTFSSTQNMFTAIGCNTVAQISDGSDIGSIFASGCLSLCRPGTTIKSLDFMEHNFVYCGGFGCCQTPIPQGLRRLNISLSLYNKSSQQDNNTCSYGFLSGSTFIFKETPERDTLVETTQRDIFSEVVLDWAVGEMTCEEAKSNGAEYICGSNTYCINSTNGAGYRCLCKDGFKGNPYGDSGCEDIDECLSGDANSYPCKGRCKNTVGNYTCDCSFGYEGDGKVGCSMKTTTKILLGIGAFVVIVTSVVISLWLSRKKIQWSNHRRNGGLLIEQFTIKTFKNTLLQKATDNFHNKRILGEGGNGWVYRGLLPGQYATEIAVKKSKKVDQDQIEQFLSEAEIVSKINHRNVVKLLGLCLDSKVPMLVYEFVKNGTLYQHLHGNKSRILDSWRICLRVAGEVARALDYMHSLAYPPIIHRDVKSSNVLLDDTYTAKVADFGASKLIRTDQAIADTKGQGTLGYLDPEYLQTGELTTMSDVYGFGVVLMELLSKQKPISRGVSGEAVALVNVFTSAIENNQFDQVLKVAEVNEHETGQVRLVAKLAVRCVAMPSTRKPTMTEVADVLNRMSKEYDSAPVQDNEVVSLLDDQDDMTKTVYLDFESSNYASDAIGLITP